MACPFFKRKAENISQSFRFWVCTVKIITSEVLISIKNETRNLQVKELLFKVHYFLQRLEQIKAQSTESSVQ